MEFDIMEIMVNITETILKRLCCLMLYSVEYGLLSVPFGI